MYLKENRGGEKKNIYKRAQRSLKTQRISFSIQLARILIALQHIQEYSAKFIHSSLRPGMSGRSLPISTTLRISNDGIQRKLDVELLKKGSLTKKLKLWDFSLCQLHDWVKNVFVSMKQKKQAHNFHEHKRERRKIYWMICKS